MSPTVTVANKFAQAAKILKHSSIEDSVRWTLEQLKTRFPAMVKQARYEEIAERIDQQAITDHLTPIRAGDTR